MHTLCVMRYKYWSRVAHVLQLTTCTRTIKTKVDNIMHNKLYTVLVIGNN